MLADAVAQRLRGRNVDPDAVEWDAWRREDGRWTLVADYRSGGSARHAEFVFDAAGRYVLAEDDEARWMVGEQTSVKGPQPRATPGPRRLSSVDDEDVLPLGEDAIEMVAEDHPTTDLSQTVAAVRAQEPPRLEEQSGTGDADWIATQASERPAPPPSSPAATPPPVDSAGAARTADRAVEDPVELGSEADDADEGDGSVEPGRPADEQPDATEAAAAEVPRRATRKSRRPSVPSWDEIMFGGGKQE